VKKKIIYILLAVLFYLFFLCFYKMGREHGRFDEQRKNSIEKSEGY